MNTLASRLQSLVDEVHGGSALAAARTIGITRPRLLRMLSGATSTPADVLERISGAYGASFNWLLLGEGAPPAVLSRPQGLPWSEILEWQQLVNRAGSELHLETETIFTLQRLPFVMAALNEDFLSHRPAAPAPEAIAGLRHAFAAYTAWLGAVLKYGSAQSLDVLPGWLKNNAVGYNGGSVARIMTGVTAVTAVAAVANVTPVSFGGKPKARAATKRRKH
jgi:hypothetical protein